MTTQKLLPHQIHAAYVRHQAGEPVKALAYEYGVHYETMRKYLRQQRKGVR